MPQLGTDQRNVVKRSLRVARQMKASPRETKALLEALAVESGYRDLSYGDRDSVGALQQRPSQGWGPASESLETDVKQFLSRAQKANTGKGSAGQLAQAVQRSAFPAKYGQRGAEAEQLLRQYSPGASAGAARAPGSTTTRAEYETTPAVDRSGERLSARLGYLEQRGKPGALLGLKSELEAAQDVPEQTVKVGETTTTTPGRTTKAKSTARGTAVDEIQAEAELINAAQVPYKWGGGHEKKQVQGSKVKPLDCSGAVSRVLGINPRVSGQFESWGRAGKGKKVTIYANAEHVLMEIDGHFFGTSQSNPGGGAGWIPRGKVSKEYLARFKARHPPGM